MSGLVFGIGLNKTATSTLDAAMSTLGFRSLHWGGPAIRQRIERAMVERRPMLDGLDTEYEMFSDILAIAQYFDVLDRQYPGSKFIYTVRDIDDWIDSRRRHVEKNQQRAEAGEYTGNFTVVEPDKWRHEWTAHESFVRTFFAERDDLLTIDLTTESSWERLCEFVERPVPDEAFPWANKYQPFTPADPSTSSGAQ